VKYTAIVLAGSRPGRDPLAAQFGTDIKALIAIRGEPMVRRPVRALLASTSIAAVIVLTQAPERLAAVLSKDPRLSLREAKGTIAESMLQLIADPGLAWPLLVTTADHALLDPAMIEQFARDAAGADIAVGVVEQRNLLRRFPDAQRTWLKFRGGAYTGANLFALRSPRVAPAIRLWRSVEQDRKKGWRVIALAGPLVLLGALLRLLSIGGVLARLGRRLGLSATVVQLDNPLAGIDVDKPVDHDLVEAILAGKA
jgi:GTP:adenosylcobinamide-phosphate guanylyltransferase